MVKSLNEYRFMNNPLERSFVEAWKTQNRGNKTLKYLLAGPTNKPVPVSDRDAEVAATTIQWLGSPVGQAFLEDALGIDDLRQQLNQSLEDEEM